MKFLTLILATFILFLAVKPGMDVLILSADTQQTCCSRTCTTNSNYDNSEKQSQDNDCDGKTCNPFQVCGTCVLICLDIPFYTIVVHTAFSDKVFNYESVLTSQFSAKIWQPPKTA